MLRLRSRQLVICERENPFKHGLQRGPGVRARAQRGRHAVPPHHLAARGPIIEDMLLLGFNTQNQVTGKS